MQKLFEELTEGIIAGHYLLGLKTSLEYLGECRRIMQLILEKAFPLDVDCEVFGKRRNKLLITPMSGRYREIVDISREMDGKCENLPFPANILHKNDYICKQVMFENICVIRYH